MHGSYGRSIIEDTLAAYRAGQRAKEQAIQASLKQIVIHYDVENAPLGYPFKSTEDMHTAYKAGILVDEAMRDVAEGRFTRRLVV